MLKRRAFMSTATLIPAAILSDAVAARPTDNTATAQFDPAFSSIEQNILKEVSEQNSLDAKMTVAVTIATLVTMQGEDELRTFVPRAIALGASVAEIKEAAYQCTPYIGLVRVKEALNTINFALTEHKIAIPPIVDSNVTPANRFEKGLAVQKSIFGDGIDKMHQATPDEQAFIMKQGLSAYCFGDFYTRSFLDLKARELITFTCIACLGGCESQLRAHRAGNYSVGNTRQDLIATLAIAMPYIGFPRTLNALAIVNEK